MDNLFDSIKAIKILVIGDLVVDSYKWGEAKRISSEAPVPVVTINAETRALGGAGNVANNLVALGAQVTLCGIIGKDECGDWLLAELKRLGINDQAIFVDENRNTTEKTRVLVKNQQLYRFDHEVKAEISLALVKQAEQHLLAQADAYHALILSDYGNGVLSQPMIDMVRNIAHRKGLKVFVDPRNNFKRFQGFFSATPNENEVSAEMGVRVDSNDEALATAQSLQKSLALDTICITRGAKGVLAQGKEEYAFFNAGAREVYDVTGAGDTFISTLTAMVAMGHSFLKSVRIANVAAGVSVAKVGTTTVSPQEIATAISSTAKIKSLAQMSSIAESLRTQGKSVVFTNGCFDILHSGHIACLEAARSKGDFLVVGLNSNSSVRQLKGQKRPILDENERARILSAIDCVDYVIIFEESTPLNLIKTFKPAIVAKGNDYTVEQVDGYGVIEQWGGKIELIPLVKDKSTTSVIERVKERQ